MDTQPTFGPQDVIASIVGQVANSVSERPGESRQRRDDRAQTAIGAIMAFRPRDPVEAILAGHCLMFHEMIVDDVRHAFCGEGKQTQRATRSGIVAMDRAFGANLVRRRQHRAARPQETEPADDRTETHIADRVRRHMSQIDPETPDAAASEADPDQIEADATTEAMPAPEQMTGFNRQARRALDRQIRKRLPGFARPGVTADRNGLTTTASARSAG
jgi:hypothetical protein